MITLLILIPLLAIQDSSRTAAGPAEIKKVVDIDVKVICFSHDAKLPEDDQAIGQFLASPESQASRIWSNSYSCSTLSGSQATISNGQTVAVVSGFTMTTNGGATPSFVSQQTGSVLKVTPSVKEDRVEAKLMIESSRYERAAATEKPTDEIRDSSIRNFEYEGHVVAKSGETQYIVVEQENPNKPDETRRYVLAVTVKAGE